MTMTLARRIPLLLAAIVAGYLLMGLAYKIGYVSAAGADPSVVAPAAVPDAAPAQPAPAAVPAVAPMPNPLEQPGDAISAVTKLWRSGAITSSLIVAAFLVLSVLRAKVKWLSVGYRAAVMAASIGGLGTLVDAIQRGSTPNLSMLVVAVTTAVAMFMAPKPKDAPA